MTSALAYAGMLTASGAQLMEICDDQCSRAD
jgi:hypothetical protein